MTPKQERFCEEYAQCQDIEKSMQASGTALGMLPGSMYFVYFLIDPRSNKIFYVGKGKGKRPFNHIAEYHGGGSSNLHKYKNIGEIIQSGHEVAIRYLAINLDEVTAFAIENKAIKLIGRANLTNIVGGNSQSSKEWAQFHLSIIKPFDAWVTEKHRSDLEISIYHGCIKELTDMANNGYVYLIEQDVIDGEVETREGRKN